jgi:hypothetical protein
MIINMPYEAVEFNGKAYQRKPRRGGAFNLILLGDLVPERNAEGKETGNLIFAPLVQGQSKDPLKKSKQTK